MSMFCGGRSFLALIAVTCRAVVDVAPEVSLSEDGKSLSVSLTHRQRSCKYHLAATNNYADDAKITVHTDQGVHEHRPPASRIFVSRAPGMWATAILGDNNNKSQKSVSGFFVCENVLLDIAPWNHGISSSDATMRQGLAAIHNHPAAARPRRASDGSDRTVAGDSDDGYDIAIESPSWELPYEVSAYFGLTTPEWNGEKWYGDEPGSCYDGDNKPHVFKVGLVVDVAAMKEHGKRIDDLVNEVIGRTSFIYEHQFHVRLQIEDEVRYESPDNAPKYAQGTCYKFDTQEQTCSGVDTLLALMTSGPHPRGGAVQLLTGCGTGSGCLGLAHEGSMCTSKATAVTQLHNSMSWLAFAHELGHVLGGRHSFEEGQKTTGGIMDYGDGKYQDEYQFNTKYRKTQMCGLMNQHVNKCGEDYFKEIIPCGYGLEACRVAAERLGLVTTGTEAHAFAGKYSETGCFHYLNGNLNGYAWYGLKPDGLEVDDPSDLTAPVGTGKKRLEGSFDCVEVSDFPFAGSISISLGHLTAALSLATFLLLYF